LPPASPNFIAREAELHEIKDYFDAAMHPSPKILLHGLGGVGKTEIALAYAHNHMDIYPNIFWVDADTEQTVNASFRVIAQDIVRATVQAEAMNAEVSHRMMVQTLGLQGIIREDTFEITQQLNATQEQRVVQAVRQWLSDSAHRNWLLILDNVDDLTSYKIADYLPTTNGHTIITSRRSASEFPFQAIAVDILPELDAVRLLLQLTRKIKVGQSSRSSPARLSKRSLADLL
jgi:hypothetical protein